MSQAQSSVWNTPRDRDGNDRKPVVIPFSSRLHEGRALAQDVWATVE